jgi:hypothetical protein
LITFLENFSIFIQYSLFTIHIHTSVRTYDTFLFLANVASRFFFSKLFAILPKLEPTANEAVQIRTRLFYVYTTSIPLTTFPLTTVPLNPPNDVSPNGVSPNNIFP